MQISIQGAVPDTSFNPSMIPCEHMTVDASILIRCRGDRDQYGQDAPTPYTARSRIINDTMSRKN